MYVARSMPPANDHHGGGEHRGPAAARAAGGAQARGQGARRPSGTGSGVGAIRASCSSYSASPQDRKGLIDEASEALAALGPLSEPSCSHDAQLEGLDQLVTRLQGLKRKLADVGRAERDEAARCRARLEHLAALGAPARGATVAWNRPRLDRILVDHLLRSGCHESASALAGAAGIRDLCELSVFGGARRVADALRSRDAAPALAWCGEQRARLKKAKSPLEFKLRLQEFIELLRKARRSACARSAPVYEG
jgi:macrophage erythroblast attacher